MQSKIECNLKSNAIRFLTSKTHSSAFPPQSVSTDFVSQPMNSFMGLWLHTSTIETSSNRIQSQIECNKKSSAIKNRTQSKIEWNSISDIQNALKCVPSPNPFQRILHPSPWIHSWGCSWDYRNKKYWFNFSLMGLFIGLSPQQLQFKFSFMGLFL